MHAARTVLKAAVVLMALALPAQAVTTVFDSGVDAANVDTGSASDLDAGPAGIQTAGEASLGSQTMLTGMTWTGFFFPSDTPTSAEDFRLDFFAGGGTTPGDLLGSVSLGSVARSLIGSVNGRDLYEYTASFSFLADAGSIFVSILNDTTGDTDDNWFWGTDSTTSAKSQRLLPSGAWASGTGAVDFTLFGVAVVPLPAGLPLLLTALGGLGLAARRKKRIG